MKSNLICTSNGSPACGDDYQSSYHDVYDIPMKEISRPLLPTIDENKVQSLMETIQKTNFDGIDPIDVLWYEAPNSGNNYFFSMGCCHRWEAHKRLNLSTIRAKLIRTTLNDLKIYLGSSLPNLE